MQSLEAWLSCCFILLESYDCNMSIPVAGLIQGTGAPTYASAEIMGQLGKLSFRSQRIILRCLLCGPLKFNDPAAKSNRPAMPTRRPLLFQNSAELPIFRSPACPCYMSAPPKVEASYKWRPYICNVLSHRAIDRQPLRYSLARQFNGPIFNSKRSSLGFYYAPDFMQLPSPSCLPC